MRLAAIASIAFLALARAAAAQPFDTPEALLEAVYAPYFSGEFSEDEAEFRSEALNALYEADAQNTPEGEMGALSFDPYIDGQDFEIAEFEIGEPLIDGDTATVDVTFTNFGEPRAITYDLVFEDGSWKIDDLEGENAEFSYRLTEIFAGVEDTSE
ncbi:DUF3828 domain-containing protein [Devosia rhizoryzae]|uniref:DUF3828 domain-containing protein n=1 Tax=Devosia rhizoryzae TaxID=2774137 RepID=A0ABX7C7J5_9HYPH|nr:DUF3828 domain-containing protein [Devosia rhizoryzae]QQR40193.1 DUF3828 domain-containing protein [Devosia rhizoryzae]